eukprot:TRINITY_DN6410_c0_g3_i4.p1 TRINITY_DN6410_c0_g3~~TRINITY_DN6410_c0_g3_i4.p1  ORF type:complete len:358 (+),score=34.88 TRINITY_DN6410_c0_g3_i4:151-1224(+)
MRLVHACSSCFVYSFSFIFLRGEDPTKSVVGEREEVRSGEAREEGEESPHPQRAPREKRSDKPHAAYLDHFEVVKPPRRKKDKSKTKDSLFLTFELGESNSLQQTHSYHDYSFLQLPSHQTGEREGDVHFSVLQSSSPPPQPPALQTSLVSQSLPTRSSAVFSHYGHSQLPTNSSHPGHSQSQVSPSSHARHPPQRLPRPPGHVSQDSKGPPTRIPSLSQPQGPSRGSHSVHTYHTPEYIHQYKDSYPSRLNSHSSHLSPLSNLSQRSQSPQHSQHPPSLLSHLHPRSLPPLHPLPNSSPQTPPPHLSLPPHTLPKPFYSASPSPPSISISIPISIFISISISLSYSSFHLLSSLSS